jgi:linoleoyl-CoA desaturase
MAPEHKKDSNHRDLPLMPSIPVQQAGSLLRPKFSPHNEFQAALRRRVDAYFERSGRRVRDCPQMYVKTIVILLGFALSYGLLVFVADTWLLALPLAGLLGLCTALIGFNIMHDGGHGAYSRRQGINVLMAASLDLIGGSSYLWHWKHGVLHHTYPNVSGLDGDVELGVLGRLTPHQRRRAHHRWQHAYIWPLYGMLAIKWHLFDDFRDLIAGRIGSQRIPRPRGRELAILVGGKLAFFTLAFGIPMLVHAPWVVVAYYGVAALVLGMALSLVFQLAHCVEEAAFPLPAADTHRLERPWAAHQVETTVDFLRRSRVAAWLLGGLNFQIEHHLFPRICHVNYPALSPLVEQTCREFGIRYHEHRTLWAGIVSHTRWLRLMSARVSVPA